MTDQTLPEVSPTKTFNQYFSTVPSIQIVDTTGKFLIFVAGRYCTDKPAEIAFLDQVIRDGNGTIFIDPEKLTISAEELDPTKALEAQFRKKFLEEMRAQLDPNNDRGTSNQGPLNAASTSDIAPVAAGGNAVQGGLAARLMGARTN